MSTPQEIIGSASEPVDVGKIWKCPFCYQSVLITAGRPALPPRYYETCRLRDTMIADECLAYRNLRRALQLIEVHK
jgi:hypothetical protein